MPKHRTQNLKGPITVQQKRVIWGTARKSLGMDTETLYAIIYRLFDKEHMSDMSAAEGEILIEELRRNAAGIAVDKLTEPQYRKIMAMSAEFGWSARGITKYLENEVGVSEVKWLDVFQARVAITGLTKIRAWREQHPQEVTLDGIR